MQNVGPKICLLQELEMAFRRVRRRYMEARKADNVKPIVEDLLQAIEGNGMTIRAWFEVMDQIAINNMVTQHELSQGMRALQIHSMDGKKQPVLTAEKVGRFTWWFHTKHGSTQYTSWLRRDTRQVKLLRRELGALYFEQWPRTPFSPHNSLTSRSPCSPLAFPSMPPPMPPILPLLGSVFPDRSKSCLFTWMPTMTER